ncbi:NADH:ubiquinone oxidoreductase [Stutzerimonas tarimensis]|uniref:NADH:ubiquinone oxidoreductase n=1 Tax=Stutzerimonas tarimensis TaxID=1507735 RepID=A0ABV7T5E9_9GAMM
MRLLILSVLLLASSQSLADACIIHSQGERVEVKVCQQNRSIPSEMFHKGFCQPRLQGQKVEVTRVEQCPIGYFGACRNARVGGMPYQQDIYYYGVPSDARYLKPACEQQSGGVWTGFR